VSTRRQFADQLRQPQRDHSDPQHRVVRGAAPDSIQKYGLAEDIAVNPEGFVHAPSAPGLGAAIDFDLIEKKKIGELSGAAASFETRPSWALPPDDVFSYQRPLRRCEAPSRRTQVADAAGHPQTPRSLEAGGGYGAL
jgi:hypothetical protein